jgi:hypothetical protein
MATRFVKFAGLINCKIGWSGDMIGTEANLGFGSARPFISFKGSTFNGKSAGTWIYTNNTGAAININADSTDLRLSDVDFSNINNSGHTSPVISTTGSLANLLAVSGSTLQQVIGPPGAPSFKNLLTLPSGGSGDASTNTSTSVDNEIALFSGTTGKTVKRASGSGFIKATSGVAGYQSSISLTSDISGTLPVANGGTGTTTPGIVAGTNISVTGTWPNQTINSTSAFTGITNQDTTIINNGSSTPLKVNPNIVTAANYFNKGFPFTNTSYFSGTSITAGYLVSESYANIVQRDLGNTTINNLAVASTATRTATWKLAGAVTVPMTGPSLSDAAFNNSRWAFSNPALDSTHLFGEINAGARWMAALQFGNNIQFYRGSGGTINPNVTTSGSSVSALAADTLKDLQSRALSVSGASPWYKTSVTTNEWVQFTNVAGTAIAVGVYADSVGGSRATIAVDGNTIGTYDPNGRTVKTDLDGPSGFNSKQLQADVFIVHNLRDTLHVVKVTMLDGGKFGGVDFVSGLKTPQQAALNPLYVIDIQHMTPAGYAITGGSSAVQDSATNSRWASLMATFPEYYSAFVRVPLNSYFIPDSTVDGIHPNGGGHMQYAKAILSTINPRAIIPASSSGGISGLTNNVMPISNGTTLVNGPITSDGTNITNTLSGKVISKGYSMTGTQPQFVLNATGAATDQKATDFYSDAATGDIIFRNINDAGSAATEWMHIVKSSYTTVGLRFPTLAGHGSGYATLDNNGQLGWGAGGGGGSGDLDAVLTAGKNSSGYATTDSKMELGTLAFQPQSADNNLVGSNVKSDGTNLKYIATGYGGMFQFYNGNFRLGNFTSGTGGTTATSNFVTPMVTTTIGNTKVGGNNTFDDNNNFPYKASLFAGKDSLMLNSAIVSTGTTADSLLTIEAYPSGRIRKVAQSSISGGGSTTAPLDLGGYYTGGFGLRQGDITIQSNDAANTFIGNNLEVVSGGYRYRTTAGASKLHFASNGNIFITNAPSGTGGTAPTFNFPLWINTGGNVNIGGNVGFTTNAWVDLPASTTGFASLNIPSGTAPSSPNNGDVWQASNHLYARLNGVSQQLDQQSGGTPTSTVTDSSTSNFASTAMVSATLGGLVDVEDASYTVATGVNTVRLFLTNSTTRTITIPAASAMKNQEMVVYIAGSGINWNVTSSSNFFQGKSSAGSIGTTVAGNVQGVFRWKSNGTNWYLISQ